ncbi:MAG TPA: sigma-70 family RNA polymerase sigma factor [Verrucomicrobiae bacterium]
MADANPFHELEESNAFDTAFHTEWFTVEAATRPGPAAAEALERLCRTYWYPLYAYVRHRGHEPADAQDLTQEFFAHLLERPWLDGVHPSKGKFRSFLLASMKHFLANEWRRGQAQKRGSGRTLFSLEALAAGDLKNIEPSHHETPDRAFEHHWANAVFDQALARLRSEYTDVGKGALFDSLKGCLKADEGQSNYAEVAKQFGMSRAAVKKAAQRLRERCRVLLREELAHTVPEPGELDEELHWLFTALAG